MYFFLRSPCLVYVEVVQTSLEKEFLHDIQRKHIINAIFTVYYIQESGIRIWIFRSSACCQHTKFRSWFHHFRWNTSECRVGEQLEIIVHNPLPSKSDKLGVNVYFTSSSFAVYIRDHETWTISAHDQGKYLFPCRVLQELGYRIWRGVAL